MNKRSVKKVRSVKPSRAPASRKAPVRKASARKTPARQPIKKPEPSVVKKPEPTVVMASSVGITSTITSTVTVAEVVARAPSFHSHRFQVGQTVFYTSSPISRPGASGSYAVVKLLPSDGEDYQYRIKNPGEAFERVAKESQLEVES
jgi:hypothetical protein